jgi:PhzF family phenazine biosynthesis protein
VKLFQVDSFAQSPFKGNPAAVCLLTGPADDTWMQRIAAKVNLAATAFVEPRPSSFWLRWFSPRVELTLCGHGTLAAAHVLWEEGLLDARDQARFQTVAGVLTAQREGPWIQMDFPAERERQEPEVPEELLRGLHVASAAYVGKNRLDYLVELDSDDVVAGLAPDGSVLERMPARGVIVTARGRGNYDFVSRYFAPAIGIDEDNATGSAHCCLGPFWASRLGKSEMLAFQASPRGGVIRVRLDGDRVRLGGRAVTVGRGEIVQGRMRRGPP